MSSLPSPIDYQPGAAHLAELMHDLRTPLASILSLAYLLLHDEQQPLVERHGERVKLLQSAAMHLLSMVDQWSAGHAVQAESRAPEAIDVSVVLAESIGWVSDDARRAGVQLAFDPVQVVVRGCRVSLARVFGNLLSNAIKYNRAGGRVEITSRTCADAVRIAFDDTGPGIAPTDVARIFEPFERLDATRHQVAGSGLGLSISRHLVEAMGGRIEVSSEPGVGSRFEVVLPSVKWSAP